MFGSFLIFLFFSVFLCLFLYVSFFVYDSCNRLIGKPENIRLLNISMFQGAISKQTAALTADMKASDNPALQEPDADPTVFATAFKKNRFYMVSRRCF